MTNDLDRQVCSWLSASVALVAGLVGMSVAAGEPASAYVLDAVEAVEALPQISEETDESGTRVDIPDAALRKAVEEMLGKEPGDPITHGEMATVRSLETEGVRQLEGIEHAVNLSRLSLDSGAISDVSQLAGLTSLTFLDLNRNAISDLSPLAGLTSLTWLGLGDNAISDVSPLAGLTSLTWLGLGDNAISDVSPLADLTSLARLELGDNVISDVSPLAGLTSLTWLGLGDNAISDVSPLADLTSLARLVLARNALTEVSLSGLASLTELHLHGNALTEVSLSGLTSLTVLHLRGNNALTEVSLSGLTSLTVLDLHGNALTEVSLSGLTSLTVLSLGGNALTDVSALADLTSLTSLSLGPFPTNVRCWPCRAVVPSSRNEIADISPLSGLTSLRSLNLDHNDIADVSPLAGLSSLTVLSLSYNEIADVSPLADLNSLRTLVLDGNEIADVSPLSALTSLRLLDVGHNKVADVSRLAGLISLTKLRLFHNEIADVSPLAALNSLTELRLDSNRLSDVLPLANMTTLTRLDLSDNEITDLSPLANMTGLTSLRVGLNGIADVSPLAGMVSLRQLGLQVNNISDLMPLVGMASLTELFLSNNAVSDVTALAGLTSLKYLSLGVNGISDVSPLVANEGLGQGDYVNLIANPLGPRSRDADIPALLQRGVRVTFTEPTALPAIADIELRKAAEWALYKELGHDDFQRLRSLDASDRGVESLAGIEAGTNLRGLYLDGNRITDIAPVAELGHLSVLTLAHNRVEDWTPLASMGRVYHLALDGNALHDVPPLPPSLRYLYMTDNSITDIGSLADFWLVELQLDGNSITSLAPLAGMWALEYLHVNDNEVADLSPLNFHSLRELLVHNNVVQDLSPLLNGEELLIVDVRRNPLADDALVVLDTLRQRRVTVLAGETVPYFPAAGDNRQGFVRIVNRNDADGHVFIEAVDDAGVRAGPVRLEVGARRAVQFNSTDLEYGNAAKGLNSGIGAPTAGNWRLSAISALDVEVLSYIRTEDGFVTAMHDVAADAVAPFFNPGSNENQRSILRVVNTEAEPAKWTTGGYDDGGKWHPMAGSLLVRPQHALTLTAQALENTHGLGDGHGKWRLRVRGFPWFAMSLLESPTGHLTNLSTTPDNATPLEDGATLHRLPLFPAAGGARQGFARVINRSFTASGEVVIHAVDDAGTRSAPVRLTLRPRQAAHFNSADLENGNAAKGLDGAVGVGEGDWRLEVTSELDLTVLAYARTEDGFLTSLHDMAPREEDGALWIPFFNPGNNRNQVSHLRLMNWGDAPAEATITGTDDAGRSPGDAVRVTIPARTARQFTAAELEAGSAEGLSGALGDGQGKWRLRVVTSDEVDAMSLLSLPTGHMTNLSTTPRFGPQQGYRR